MFSSAKRFLVPLHNCVDDTEHRCHSNFDASRSQLGANGAVDFLCRHSNVCAVSPRFNGLRDQLDARHGIVCDLFRRCVVVGGAQCEIS